MMRRSTLILALSVTCPVLAYAPPAKAQNELPLHRIDVILADFSFTPGNLPLKAGEAVTLHFVNKGSGGHNFTATKFFAAAKMDEATRAALGKAGQVSLEKGEAMDVALVPMAGTYPARCTHFFHTNLGMKGRIIVR